MLLDYLALQNAKIEKGNKNFRQFHQICVICNDCIETAKLWAETVGAGPFTVALHKETSNLIYKGVHYGNSWLMHGANGHWGPIQIEIMQSANDCPARHFDPLPRLGKLHHVNYVVSDIEKETARLEALGFPVIWEASTISMPIRMFDAGDFLLEVYQYLDATEQGYRGMSERHENWDGTNPIGGYYDCAQGKMISEEEALKVLGKSK